MGDNISFDFDCSVDFAEPITPACSSEELLDKFLKYPSFKMFSKNKFKYEDDYGSDKQLSLPGLVQIPTWYNGDIVYQDEPYFFFRCDKTSYFIHNAVNLEAFVDTNMIMQSLYPDRIVGEIKAAIHCSKWKDDDMKKENLVALIEQDILSAQISKIFSNQSIKKSIGEIRNFSLGAPVYNLDIPGVLDSNIEILSFLSPRPQGGKKGIKMTLSNEVNLILTFNKKFEDIDFNLVVKDLLEFAQSIMPFSIGLINGKVIWYFLTSSVDTVG